MLTASARHSVAHEDCLVVEEAEIDLADALDEFAEPLRALRVPSLRKRRRDEAHLDALEVDRADDVGAAVDRGVVVRHRLARDPGAGLRVVVHASRPTRDVVELVGVRRRCDLVGESADRDPGIQICSLARIVVLHHRPQILERRCGRRLEIRRIRQRLVERRRVRIDHVEVLTPEQDRTTDQHTRGQQSRRGHSVYRFGVASRRGRERS